MQIQLSDHFDYKRLIRYSIPSIAMMIFTSIYGVIDGIFVSNYVGVTEFAALNLIFPFLMIPGALGFMLGTGGTALVAKTMGEGDNTLANRYFSMITYMALIISAVIGTACYIFIEPIAIMLGADAALLPHCVLYGRIIILGLPAFMMQNIFQCFTMTAEMPKFGFYVTVAAGCTNIIGDYILVGVLDRGLFGAATASVLSQVIGGMIPLVYFARKNKSPLKLGRFYFRLSPFIRSCINGLSEFVSNISMSVVNMVYNLRLMAIAGENGISAYGVIMYACFLFVGLFYGYSLAVSPIIGYHFGAGNNGEMKNLLVRSLVLIGFCAAVMTALAEILAPTVSGVFVGYDPALYDLTVTAFRIYSISFVLCGFNIFASAFFTALNDGVTSGAISFLRTFVFQLTALIFLPMLLPETYRLIGIWSAIIVAEALSLAVSLFLLAFNRRKYGYM